MIGWFVELNESFGHREDVCEYFVVWILEWRYSSLVHGEFHQHFSGLDD